jgi:hypothetical protein
MGQTHENVIGTESDRSCTISYSSLQLHRHPHVHTLLPRPNCRSDVHFPIPSVKIFLHFLTPPSHHSHVAVPLLHKNICQTGRRCFLLSVAIDKYLYSSLGELRNSHFLVLNIGHMQINCSHHMSIPVTLPSRLNDNPSALLGFGVRFQSRYSWYSVRSMNRLLASTLLRPCLASTRRF